MPGECDCRDKTGPGHDTGPVAVLMRGIGSHTEIEEEPCLNRAVWVGVGWPRVWDHWFGAEHYVHHGGAVVDGDALDQVVEWVEAKLVEADRAERAERVKTKKRRITLEHPEIGDVPMGVTATDPGWYLDRYGPFGFNVRSAVVR